MRIRLPFAGTFLILCLLAGYAGLSSLQLGAYINDKVLHLLTFFTLTAVFYWIVDTGRRRALHLTLVTCTLAGGVGSEFVQGYLIPGNGREFDPADIAANLVGSLAALALCAWYHRRMLERRRVARARYNVVPGEDEEDLELGESLGLSSGGGGSGGGDDDGQEEGVIARTHPPAGTTARTLEHEVDQWDENALDSWDEEEEDDEEEEEESDEDDSDDSDEDDDDSHNVEASANKPIGKSSGGATSVVGDNKKRVD